MPSVSQRILKMLNEKMKNERPEVDGKRQHEGRIAEKSHAGVHGYKKKNTTKKKKRNGGGGEKKRRDWLKKKGRTGKKKNASSGKGTEKWEFWRKNGAVQMVGKEKK